MRLIKNAILGGDLGGTKFAYAVYPVETHVSATPITQGEVPTEIGAQGLRHTIQRAFVEAAAALCEHQIAAIGIGSPGRPIFQREAPENAFIVAPTSAGNLETFPGELSHANLQQIMQEAIPVPLYMNNDAIVQMQAIIVELLTKRGEIDLYGKKVGYIGMGTGLGGGFAKIAREGTIHPYTDGHIYDTCLEMRQDRAVIDLLNATLTPEKKFQFDPTGAFIRAEDILSGSAFEKMAGRRGEAIASDQEAEEARPILELMGRGLAELIVKTHTCQIKKLDPLADWPAGDLEEVKGTNLFLIGGGMGRNPHLMGIIRQTALTELRAQGIHTVNLIYVRDVRTTFAAANIVPQSALRQMALG